MAENFLSRLTQSGALNVANPMESYMNALKMKAVQTQMKGAELDSEGKTLTILKGIIPMMSGPEDLDKTKEYYKKKMPGFNWDAIPDSKDLIGPDKAYKTFADWQFAATSTATERLKAKEGKPFTIWTMDKSGRTTKDKDMTTDKLEALQGMGLLGKFGTDWGFGEVTHQPPKPTESKFKTFYDKNGNPHTIDTTKEKPQADWSEDRPLKETGSKFKTYYDKEGKPHTIDTTKESPQADWSEHQPKTTKEETTPTNMKDFEMTEYGKEVPELRGTPEYKTKRLAWIKSQKEQSPYVDALNRQIEVQQKKEGSLLRKEFNALPETKTYTEVRQKMEVMKEALKVSRKGGNFVATDQALITLYNKMTDPESVVRESEYARTANDLALWNRLKGKVEKWKSGGAGLTQEDREALVKMAEKFMNVSEKKYRERLHEYRGYLSNYGLEPDKYLTPYGKKESSSIEERKTIGNKPYIKKDGKWYEE